MSKVLLVGVDCSKCSNRALQYAADRAEVSKVQLIVTHVIDWSPFSFNTPQENEERHKRREAELDRAHKEIIDPIVSELREKSIFARGVIRHGHPAETLSGVAEEFGATNIIIGKTGSSKIKTQLFGSVANTLVQISKVPVTIVP
ncbi:MAG: universal stress protein [Xanthomonadales bacterium]|nr:universal stress protein [Gammaproteobacteria bacterium]MBT8055142.1 universal stress protein [Gammaproteobacteria bacterium]NND58369.1 universal stress protein [Xanthomonadales bacterium]NNK51736.1 universal stress protein [Xanthomonadales bacterium]